MFYHYQIPSLTKIDYYYLCFVYVVSHFFLLLLLFIGFTSSSQIGYSTPKSGMSLIYKESLIKLEVKIILFIENEIKRCLITSKYMIPCLSILKQV